MREVGLESEDKFETYVKHPRQMDHALFIRTGRKTPIMDNDKDLVLLQAPVKGKTVSLMYEVDFDVTGYPEVKVKKIHVRNFIGYRLGDGEWEENTNNKLPKQYLIRQFRMLLEWQKGMVSGADV